MAWQKAVVGQLSRVVLETTDTTLAVGGISAGNSSTFGINPLGGDRIWDDAACFLSVDNIISGTWAVEVQGTIAGITQLPLARVAGVTATVMHGGFEGSSQVARGTSSMRYGMSCMVMNSATYTPSMLNPAQVAWDNTSAGGITASVIVVAKTNRGSLPRGTLNRSRVQEGIMLHVPVVLPGAYFLDTAGVTQGITQSTIVNLSHTTAVGTTAFGVFGGLDAVQVWDSQHYWMHVIGCSGLWNVMIQGLIPTDAQRGTSGHWVTIAGLSNIGAGTSATGITKAAFRTFGSAATIAPGRIVFDLATPEGVSQNIAGTILYAAKTSRGQRHLR